MPLLVLASYFGVLAFALAHLAPEYSANVNAAFAAVAWQASLGAGVVCGLAAGVLARREGPGRLRLRGRPARPRAGDLLLILLPLMPVTQYVYSNRDILSVADALRVTGVFAGLSALFVLVLPAALSTVATVRSLMAVGLAFTFTTLQMAALSAQMRWLERGDPILQLFLCGGVAVLGYLMLGPTGRSLAWRAVVLFFLANGVVRVLAEDGEETARAGVDRDHPLTAAIGARTPDARPDVFLLVYDAYVPNETMLAYGIDNREQEEHLVRLGFTLYPRTYSVARSSLGTMSRLLDVSAELRGNSRRGVSGRGAVHEVLAGWGYETRGIFTSDYFFQGLGSAYDHAYPPPQSSRPVHDLLVRAILMGEFRFDIEFGDFTRAEFGAAKRAAFTSDPERPRFVYLHDRLPGHSQNSGRCRPEETDLFRERLVEANREMRTDLAAVLAAAPEALVVVAGDHGPHLTKNCHATGDSYRLEAIDRLDIQDRYGSFLAVRWPSGMRADTADIRVLQDVFPAVFARLLDDPRLLAARIPAATTWPEAVSGAVVRDGVIHGGIDDGEPLFTGVR